MPRTFDKTGRPATGRVRRVLSGQGHGFIRLTDGREVFFHRADTPVGTPFHDLREGAVVVFDLLDDPVSGPRGVNVRLAAAGERPRR